MNDKIAVSLIIGIPAIVGMSCILYSIFYESDYDNDNAIRYKSKQPVKLSYDDELVNDTGYYQDQESMESNIDYLKQDSIPIYEDG